jgi:K+-transporting ATPase ATPase C chain
MSHLRPAIVLLLLFTALTGIGYPLALTGLAQALFPDQANGSLVRTGDKVIGSRLVGQAFATDRYLQPRPSATSGADPANPDATVDQPYNAAASTGSNFGPTSAKLAERLAADTAKIRAAGFAGPIPGDAVTTSGSGLDPDISVATALMQVPRIAAARGVPEATVRRIILDTASAPDLGVFGEPRVNVLAANLALDRARS